MDALFPAFLDEARLLLERLARSLHILSDQQDNAEFENVFRDLHTLKSSARTVGLMELGALLHDIETQWEQSRTENNLKEQPLRLLRAIEALTEALREGKLNNPHSLSEVADLWSGKISSIHQHLRIPEDIHLSPALYERLMGATESVLSSKTKVEVLGSSLLRVLERAGKNETSVGGEFENASRQLHLATNDLEASMRDARMTPLSIFFDRLPLLTRDVGRALGKKVDIHVSGGELQADRLVIGELGGALGHLVRNAIDHGIFEHGSVRIDARQDHDHLFVVVEDNGRGIQYEALEAIAKERGVIHHDAILGTEARQELLFHPHISTTLHATEISGRGMGMSAVREYVRSVGGSITVESPLERGGTRVTLRIPTSLSLVRILLVRAGHATLGIPMTDLRETTPFSPEMLTTEDGTRYVNVRGRRIPLLPLREMLDLDGGYYRKGNPLLLHLETERGEVAMHVDAVLHEEEVLVKALPRLLSSLEVFRGAAKVGDGRTILVLDAGGLGHMPVPAHISSSENNSRLSLMERDQLMEIMNMVASHAGSALSRRFGTHIELSVPECADGVESLPEEDWGSSSIGVRMSLEGEYPGNLLFEMPATLCGKLTELLRSQKADLHALSGEERAFFQEIGQIAMHAVGNMLSKISKNPVMTKMSDIRVDARGALRTYFLTAHQGSPEELVRVRLWFGVGEGIRTDDHRETGSLTMELKREDAKKLLASSQNLAQ